MPHKFTIHSVALCLPEKERLLYFCSYSRQEALTSLTLIEIDRIIGERLRPSHSKSFVFSICSKIITDFVKGTIHPLTMIRSFEHMCTWNKANSR